MERSGNHSPPLSSGSSSAADNSDISAFLDQDFEHVYLSDNSMPSQRQEQSGGFHDSCKSNLSDVSDTDDTPHASVLRSKDDTIVECNVDCKASRASMDFQPQLSLPSPSSESNGDAHAISGNPDKLGNPTQSEAKHKYGWAVSKGDCEMYIIFAIFFTAFLTAAVIVFTLSWFMYSQAAKSIRDAFAGIESSTLDCQGAPHSENASNPTLICSTSLLTTVTSTLAVIPSMVPTPTSVAGPLHLKTEYMGTLSDVSIAQSFLSAFHNVYEEAYPIAAEAASFALEELQMVWVELEQFLRLVRHQLMNFYGSTSHFFEREIHPKWVSIAKKGMNSWESYNRGSTQTFHFNTTSLPHYDDLVQCGVQQLDFQWNKVKNWVETASSATEKYNKSAAAAIFAKTRGFSGDFSSFKDHVPKANPGLFNARGKIPSFSSFKKPRDPQGSISDRAAYFQRRMFGT